MTKQLLTILYSCCLATSGFTQHFLADFTGNYQGHLKLCRTEIPCDSIAFGIQIEATESPYRFKQTTTYTLPNGETSAKNYVLELDKNDLSKTKYTLDEQDGILIPETRVGNVFYSMYNVDKQYYHVKTAYFADRITFELVVYDEVNAVNSHSEPDEKDQTFYVSGLPYVTVQKGTAFRK